MKKYHFVYVFVLVISLVVNSSVFAYSTDINTQTFNSADDFYLYLVDKKEYEEFVDSVLNVRKQLMVKELSKVFDEKVWGKYPSAWKKHMKKTITGNTKKYTPEQEVYYFFTLKEDGEKIHIKFALYDSTNGTILTKGGGHWTKEEFKRKFVKK